MFDWLPDWLRRILERIIEWFKQPQPPRPPKARPLDADEVPVSELDFQDEPGLISPPIVQEPVYQCSTVVVVLGFISHSELDVEVNGAIGATVVAGFPTPDGETVTLPAALTAGDVLRARQRIGAVQSDWSVAVMVRDHTADYPAGLPRPEINPAPVYECGSRTGVSNLLIGCDVWITANGTEVGRTSPAYQTQSGVNVNPDYSLAQQVRAWAELCADPSPPSTLQIAQPAPSPLPVPGFESMYEGQEQIVVTNLANGARFTPIRGATSLGVRRTWGGRHLVELSPPLSAGESLSARQTLCPGTTNGTGTGTVQPCSALPAPVVGAIQEGDTRVTIVQAVPGARIKVYRNGVKVGDGGGSVILLAEAVHHGDTVHVQQILGTCAGTTVREVAVRCVNPPVAGDPSALNLFPVGFWDFPGTTTSIDGSSYPVRGTVYYPADDDGDQTPFNARLAALGRVPIVFLAHGNHRTWRDPGNVFNESCSQLSGFVEIENHKGYDYFQQQLARMGIITVSVYSNPLNCTGFSVTNVRRRAELIIACIEHFQTLDASGDPIFGGKVDFGRVGLMGHSRGGEAVVVVPEIIGLTGVTIKGVISLAPTDAGASSGKPRGYAFSTILPAADGDVVDNDGAKFYDQAEPRPLKGQIYAHRANHNYFNRQWPNDEGVGPPRLDRASHERILSAYGCAFFRAVLLSHDTVSYLNGRALPAGVTTEHVHLSFEWEEELTVDHHENGNGIAVNSLGQPTSQSGGLTADEYSFSQTGVPTFNGTFYGNTIGMVADAKRTNGEFRSELPGSVEVSGKEVWVRAADVYNGTTVPAIPTGFELGLEDASGAVGWIDTDDVGGLPLPFDRGGFVTKTMLKTLRFHAGCFTVAQPNLDPTSIRAIRFRANRAEPRPLAFDVLQIVSK